MCGCDKSRGYTCDECLTRLASAFRCELPEPAKPVGPPPVWEYVARIREGRD